MCFSAAIEWDEEYEKRTRANMQQYVWRAGASSLTILAHLRSWVVFFFYFTGGAAEHISDICSI